MPLLDLYRTMARARAFELALEDLWERGLISGEMHLGTGEEAVVAGLCAHLVEGDAVALDHRPTPMLVARGVDPVAMIKECLGRADGLCRGRGGHMHLFAPDRLAASSGIVGAAGPTAVGFALAGRRLRPRTVAIAIFGDGATNQGMLLESFNLASAWQLPVVFVCKDNGWAITTRSDQVTGGDLVARAEAFGLFAHDVDGLDAEAVADAAKVALTHARKGKGPAYLHARCARLDGHLLGDPLLKTAASPLGEGRELMGKVMKAAFKPGGGGVLARARSLGKMTNVMRKARKGLREGGDDPLVRARKRLKKAGLARETAQVDEDAAAWISEVVAAATAEEASHEAA